jgi:hypothetical protein
MRIDLYQGMLQDGWEAAILQACWPAWTLMACAARVIRSGGARGTKEYDGATQAPGGNLIRLHFGLTTDMKQWKLIHPFIHCYTCPPEWSVCLSVWFCQSTISRLSSRGSYREEWVKRKHKWCA